MQYSLESHDFNLKINKTIPNLGFNNNYCIIGIIIKFKSFRIIVITNLRGDITIKYLIVIEYYLLMKKDWI
jgi:hypothetical protein